ncbi:major facilitator superfamily domain-containing protein [Podospora didyma]|uniref:Major facilitator superfamily domain-containing protein n=1 Tax=Podospora didyma TaxID=330526 RepID=A0AAE0NCQ5_9PEZI|nr:major facilitator superfamily domain-containing protein [Podospora didyma]
MAEAEVQAGAGGFPDRGPAVFAITTATSVLAVAFVAARLVSRAGIVRKVSLDDYMILLAMLIALFMSIAINVGTTRGLGRHDANIDPNDEPGLRMCEYLFSILYNPALMASKTSILIFYLRLAKGTQKILRLASWAVLVVVNTAGIILTFMNIFQCQPINAAWDINVKPTSCIPLLTEFICSAPVNITTDLAVLALPIPVLTGMRLPRKQKTILIITFACGIFVIMADVVRIHYLQQAIYFVPTSASSDPAAIFGQSSGFSWNASLSLMWSAVEVNVGIACACVPTLKPLIIRILPAMILDPHGTRRRSSIHAQGGQNGTSDNTKPTNSEDTSTSMTESRFSIPPILPPVHSQEDITSEELTFKDFLSRTAEASTSQVSKQKRPPIPAKGKNRSMYFGFVNMEKPKSMIRTSPLESFKYCAVVSILFFLWGVSYGLLNTLNNVVAAVANISTAQALGLTSVYFGAGYFFGPLLVGEWLLRHDEHHRSKKEKGRAAESIGGFKTTFIVGLLIYGAGTIMFWPGAVLSAYGGFMVSSFVIGFGLAVLETAANPFLVLCGPPEYADARLLIAQGVQAVGSVLSGLLANKVFFNKVEERQFDSMTLLDVQWTYLAVTLLCVLLALYFYYMPLPEVSDKELAQLASQLPVDPQKRSIGGVRLKTWCIVFAVLSQWTYVAAQENMSIFFHPLLTAFLPESTGYEYRPRGFALSVLNYLQVAHAAFAVSRFGAGYLAYLSVKYPTNRFIPTPRTMLSASAGLSALFVLVAVVMPPTSNPNLMAIPIILFYLAEGPIWPLVFSLGMRGQGKRTKCAAAWLTMGASGPAFFPFVSYAVTKAGGSIQMSFIVVVALMAVSMIYPLFLTFVKDARVMVDPQAADARTRWHDGDGTADGDNADFNNDQILAQRRRFQREPIVPKLSLRLGGMMKRSRQRDSGVPVTTAPAVADIHVEKGEGKDLHAEAPWEHQELDTSILQD